jgi:hypothetical protein
MRAFTSQIGCLSVEPLFVAPSTQNSLDENGNPVGDHGPLLVGQAKVLYDHLEWMGNAMKTQRAKGLPQ